MSNYLLSPKVSSKISALIVAFEQRRNWILCDAWFVGCSRSGNNGHLRCFYQLLYTTSSRLYHRLANWRNKKFAYSKSLFIATKPHVFLKFLAFQSWLSHYIQVNPFLAGKIKRFLWILAAFFHPRFILIFFQPFLIWMAPAWHGGIQRNHKTIEDRCSNARKTCANHRHALCTCDWTCLHGINERALGTKTECLQILYAFWEVSTLFIWTFLFNSFHYVRN